MTFEQSSAAMIAGARKAIQEAVAPLVARAEAAEAALAALTARLETVETRGLEYCGAYQRAMAYRRGSAVTEAGSLWIALRAVEPGEMPADNPSAWQLAVKKGKDAQ